MRARHAIGLCLSWGLLSAGLSAAGYADEVKGYVESAIVPDPMTLFRANPDDVRASVAGAIGAVTAGKPAP